MRLPRAPRFPLSSARRAVDEGGSVPTEASHPVPKARRLLLCVAGGFQAYAVPGFVLALLRHAADDVQVVLSRAAARLVQPYAVEVASRHPVFVELDDTGPDVYVPHIELARSAELV